MAPAAVRRAAAFIEEHAHEDISIADIATAASVTARAVQLAFRRHLDTTPLRYLRRVRLDRAYHDLMVAVPGRDTVTLIAYRWGFSSASRFIAYYRNIYGVTPGQTLQTEGPDGEVLRLGRASARRPPTDDGPGRAARRPYGPVPGPAADDPRRPGS